jgi:hypothetical protein
LDIGRIRESCLRVCGRGHRPAIAPAGVETLVGVVHDPSFGPVMFGTVRMLG